MIAAPRSGTKLDVLIALLVRPDGATLDELTQAVGWLPHTTRAAITGLRKRNYRVTRTREDGRGSVYRIVAAQGGGGSESSAQPDLTEANQSDSAEAEPARDEAHRSESGEKRSERGEAIEAHQAFSQEAVTHQAPDQSDADAERDPVDVVSTGQIA